MPWEIPYEIDGEVVTITAENKPTGEHIRQGREFAIAKKSRLDAERKAKAEEVSQGRSFAGGLVRGVGPGMAGVYAGGKVAAALAPAGPWVAIPAGVIAGAGTAIGLRMGQDAISDVVAPESIMGTKEAQRSYEQNPWTTAIGENAFMMPNPIRAARGLTTLATRSGRTDIANAFRKVGAPGAVISPRAIENADAAFDVASEAAISGALGLAQGQDAAGIGRDILIGSIFNTPYLQTAPSARLKAAVSPINEARARAAAEEVYADRARAGVEGLADGIPADRRAVATGRVPGSVEGYTIDVDGLPDPKALIPGKAVSSLIGRDVESPFFEIDSVDQVPVITPLDADGNPTTADSADRPPSGRYRVRVRESLKGQKVTADDAPEAVALASARQVAPTLAAQAEAPRILEMADFQSGAQLRPDDLALGEETIIDRLPTKLEALAAERAKAVKAGNVNRVAQIDAMAKAAAEAEAQRVAAAPVDQAPPVAGEFPKEFPLAPSMPEVSPIDAAAAERAMAVTRPLPGAVAQPTVQSRPGNFPPAPELPNGRARKVPQLSPPVEPLSWRTLPDPQGPLVQDEIGPVEQVAAIQAATAQAAAADPMSAASINALGEFQQASVLRQAQPIEPEPVKAAPAQTVEAEVKPAAAKKIKPEPAPQSTETDETWFNKLPDEDRLRLESIMDARLFNDPDYTNSTDYDERKSIVQAVWDDVVSKERGIPDAPIGKAQGILEKKAKVTKKAPSSEQAKLDKALAILEELNAATKAQPTAKQPAQVKAQPTSKPGSDVPVKKKLAKPAEVKAFAGGAEPGSVNADAAQVAQKIDNILKSSTPDERNAYLAALTKVRRGEPVGYTGLELMQKAGVDTDGLGDGLQQFAKDVEAEHSAIVSGVARINQGNAIKAQEKATLEARKAQLVKERGGIRVVRPSPFKVKPEPAPEKPLPTFEEALRESVKGNAKWTDEVISNVVKWVDGGKEGPKPQFENGTDVPYNASSGYIGGAEIASMPKETIKDQAKAKKEKIQKAKDSMRKLREAVAARKSPYDDSFESYTEGNEGAARPDEESADAAADRADEGVNEDDRESWERYEDDAADQAMSILEDDGRLVDDGDEGSASFSIAPRKPHFSLTDEGQPQFTRQEIQRHLDNMGKLPNTKRIADGVIVLDTASDFLDHPALQHSLWSKEGIEKLLTGGSEGFYDPTSDKVFIIADGLRLRDGETPEVAVRRVTLHENLFHKGFRYMYDNDATFKSEVDDNIRHMPESEKVEMRKYYSDSEESDPVRFWSEIFAHKGQGKDPVRLAQGDGVFRRMWESVKRAFAKALGLPYTSKMVERQMDDFARRIFANPKSLAGNQPDASTGRPVDSELDEYGSEAASKPTAPNRSPEEYTERGKIFDKERADITEVWDSFRKWEDGHYASRSEVMGRIDDERLAIYSEERASMQLAWDSFKESGVRDDSFMSRKIEEIKAETKGKLDANTEERAARWAEFKEVHDQSDAAVREEIKRIKSDAKSALDNFVFTKPGQQPTVKPDDNEGEDFIREDGGRAPQFVDEPTRALAGLFGGMAQSAGAEGVSWTKDPNVTVNVTKGLDGRIKFEANEKLPLALNQMSESQRLDALSLIKAHASLMEGLVKSPGGRDQAISAIHSEMRDGFKRNLKEPREAVKVALEMIHGRQLNADELPAVMAAATRDMDSSSELTSTLLRMAVEMNVHGRISEDDIFNTDREWGAKSYKSLMNFMDWAVKKNGLFAAATKGGDKVGVRKPGQTRISNPIASQDGGEKWKEILAKKSLAAAEKRAETMAAKTPEEKAAIAAKGKATRENKLAGAKETAQVLRGVGAAAGRIESVHAAFLKQHKNAVNTKERKAAQKNIDELKSGVTRMLANDVSSAPDWDIIVNNLWEFRSDELSKLIGRAVPEKVRNLAARRYETEFDTAEAGLARKVQDARANAVKEWIVENYSDEVFNKVTGNEGQDAPFSQTEKAPQFVQTGKLAGFFTGRKLTRMQDEGGTLTRIEDVLNQAIGAEKLRGQQSDPMMSIPPGSNQSTEGSKFTFRATADRAADPSNLKSYFYDKDGNRIDRSSLAEEVGDSPVYHETSLKNAIGLMQSLRKPVYAGRDRPSFFVSDNIDLALGQGGRGVTIELDPRLINGTKNQNEAKRPIAGNEYVVNRAVRGAVKSVTFANEAQMNSFMKEFPDSFDWDRRYQVFDKKMGIRVPSLESNSEWNGVRHDINEGALLSQEQRMAIKGYSEPGRGTSDPMFSLPPKSSLAKRVNKVEESIRANLEGSEAKTLKEKVGRMKDKLKKGISGFYNDKISNAYAQMEKIGDGSLRPMLVALENDAIHNNMEASDMLNSAYELTAKMGNDGLISSLLVRMGYKDRARDLWVKHDRANGGKLFDEAQAHFKKMLETYRSVGVQLGDAAGDDGAYLPTRVSDMAGLEKWMDDNGFRDEWDAARASVKTKGGIDPDYVEAEKIAKAISSMFREPKGGSAIKQRTIPASKLAEVAQFYEPLHRSLQNYVFNYGNNVAIARFFGKDAIANYRRMQADKSSMSDKEIDDLLPPTSPFGLHVQKLLAEGKIKKSDITRIHEIIAARLGYRPDSDAPAFVKSFNMLAALGNVWSAMRQVPTEMVIGLMRNGSLHMASGAKRAFNKDAMTVTKHDLGLYNEQDIGHPDNWGRTVNNWMAKWSGFRAADALPATTNANAYLARVQAMSSKDRIAHLERFKHILTDTPEALSKKIESGNIKGNKDITFLAMNELSQIRPVGLSGTPLQYLRSNGLARLAYNLRLWGMFQFDAIKRQGLDNLREGYNTGNKEKLKEGGKALAWLVGGLTMAGATTDHIIDLIQGRDADFDKDVMENFIKLALMSNRYQMGKLTGDQPDLKGQVVGLLNSPFLNFVDSIYSDVVGGASRGGIEGIAEMTAKDYDLWRALPLGVGVPAYWRATSYGAEAGAASVDRHIPESVTQLTEEVKALRDLGETGRRLRGKDNRWKQLSDFEKIRRDYIDRAKTAIKERRSFAEAHHLMQELEELSKDSSSWNVLAVKSE